MLIEHLGPDFIKYHLNATDDSGIIGLPIRPVLHRFIAPDNGAPHDHPWNFTTYIVYGGYVEQRYTQDVRGRWSSTLVEHLPGTVHNVPATRIHRIVKLLAEECITFVTYGPWVQDFRWYETGDN